MQAMVCPSMPHDGQPALPGNYDVHRSCRSSKVRDADFGFPDKNPAILSGSRTLTGPRRPFGTSKQILGGTFPRIQAGNFPLLRLRRLDQPATKLRRLDWTDRTGQTNL